MSDAHGHGDGSAIEAEKAADHDQHAAAHGHGHGHDDDGHGGGHGDDPNAGVVLGTPPTPAWVLTAALIGLVTLIAAVVLAFAMGDDPSSTPDTHSTDTTQSEH